MSNPSRKSVEIISYSDVISVFSSDYLDHVEYELTFNDSIIMHRMEEYVMKAVTDNMELRRRIEVLENEIARIRRL